MGVSQSKKQIPKYHHKQKSFASESELKHLITSNQIIKDLDTKYDTKTIDRIHSHHYLLRHIWKGCFNSPIKHLFESGSIEALEIKCGPGTWVLDMATEFPKSSFTGIDMIPIFPNEIKPKNTKFSLVNKLENLQSFPPSTFSYVHINFIQHMCNDYSFSKDDDNDIISDIINVMKRDSWLEITSWPMEFENIGTVTKKLVTALISCFEDENQRSLSKMISSLQHCEQLKNTNLMTNNIPLGKWTGPIGELVMEDLLITFKEYENGVCNKLDITVKQYDSLLGDLIKEIEENHTVFKTYRFYGQKI